MNDPLPDPAADSSPSEPEVYWTPHQRFQDRRWLHALLLALTLASTTFVGAVNYAGFVEVSAPQQALGRIDLSFFLSGLSYSLSVLAILGCHELGHYLACRYYNVDASLPFFIPMPLVMTGTMGAFIRIREPIPTKRMLFDIGIAGPIAGFVVTIPLLITGIALSNVVQFPPDLASYSLGEPLLFKAVSALIWGQPPDGYTLNAHPVAFAAWFGLLATAFNLFPIGQLDGGHISYAVFGRRSSHITLAALGAIVLLITFFSWSWLGWAVVMVVILARFGRHHPPTFDEDEPLDRTRMWFAFAALVIFVLSFTPAPIEPMDIIGR